MPGIIELNNVTFTFDGEEKPVLSDLSFSLPAGSFSILVGPGGSGKSTLCNLLNGRIPHLIPGRLEGSVLIDSMNSADTEMKELSCSVGYVFQDPENMFATLSVEDEIAFGPENLIHPAEQIKSSVDELLELTELAPYRKNLVWNLSGGQIQKLGLASVLAMKPKIIVLDEPTANLDPAASRQVHELILSLRSEGITVLLVTRELDDFMAEADQILVLEDGQLAASGEPCSLLSEKGEYINSLGIWLPETVEIGLGLKKLGYSVPIIPIRIDETLKLLDDSGLTASVKSLTGRPSKNDESSQLHTGSVSEDILIKAEDLRYSYGAGLYALKGVSFDVRAGEMLAVVGRNGAGKSTLAKLLIGLNKCTEGSLMLMGKPSVKWKIPKLANHIALVFQNPEHQFLTDTVSEEIEYSLKSKGVFNKDEMAAELKRLLEELELTDSADSHPFALSAGKKRRLGVATMLVGNPSVLIVDEPTYGQDREMTRNLMKLMKDIQSRGVAVIMISHDMRLVEEYADRVIVLSEGKKYYDGIPSELFRKPEILQQSNLQPTLLSEILKKLEQKGLEINGSIPGSGMFLELLSAGGKM